MEIGEYDQFSDKPRSVGVDKPIQLVLYTRSPHLNILYWWSSKPTIWQMWYNCSTYSYTREVLFKAGLNTAFMVVYCISSSPDIQNLIISRPNEVISCE
jgi:hypothetical protein